MRSYRLTVLLLACLAVPVRADEAAAWLQRLAVADRQQGLQGTFIYERHGSFSSHAVWRGLDGQGRMRERLQQLDGPALEVFSVDGQLQCVAGGMAEQLAGAAFWPSRSLEAERLQRWYELRLVGESRVAGRDAVVLLLAPRDRHRYAFELHLDRQSALPLKSLLRDAQGQLLERFQLTSFDIDQPPSEAELQPGPGCRRLPPAPPAAVVRGRWTAQWLPEGFELMGVQLRALEGRQAALEFITYADGLARFSVFVETLAGDRVEDARHQLGPTVIVSRRVSLDEGDYMVTVVGEIPFGTAERVAVSMALAAVDGEGAP